MKESAQHYPAQNPSISQVDSMQKLSDFLKRNNCAAMSRDGDLIIMSELNKPHLYKEDETGEIFIPQFTVGGLEFEKEFKKVIGRVARLLIKQGHKSQEQRKQTRAKIRNPKSKLLNN